VNIILQTFTFYPQFNNIVFKYVNKELYPKDWQVVTMWTGFIWLRIGSSGGLSWIW